MLETGTDTGNAALQEKPSPDSCELQRQRPSPLSCWWTPNSNLSHAFQHRKTTTLLFPTGRTRTPSAARRRQPSSTSTHVLLIFIHSAKHPSLTFRHPRLIPNLHKLWRLPSLPHRLVIPSWARLRLNLKCQWLTLIKQRGTLTLRYTWRRKLRRFMLAEFVCVRWRGVVHHAPETLSKQSNKIDGGHSFLHVFIRWWNM